jgi:hypothetical protein
MSTYLPTYIPIYVFVSIYVYIYTLVYSLFLSFCPSLLIHTPPAWFSFVVSFLYLRVTLFLRLHKSSIEFS